MPKLYEYFGLVIMFYSNEHEPIHVHGKCQGRESRAEILIENGSIQHIIIKPMPGKRPLLDSELQRFEELVQAKSTEIVQKWIDYFVLHKSIQSEIITRRLK
jgi:Domain of unknown function (DUF4160)